MMEDADLSNYKIHTLVAEFKFKLNSQSKLMRSLNMALMLLIVNKMVGKQKEVFYKVTLPYSRESENILFATDYGRDAESKLHSPRRYHPAYWLYKQGPR